MKRVLCLLLFLGSALYAGEYEKLLQTVEQKIEAARKTQSDAMTQVDMNAAAAEYYGAVCEKSELVWDKLYLAAGSREKRDILRKEYAAMLCCIQQNFDDARNDSGTISGMLRASRAAGMVEQMLAVWEADAEDAARWRRVAHASGTVDGSYLLLSFGRGTFEVKAYDTEEALEVWFIPSECFTFEGIDYIVTQASDIGAVCDDWMCAVIIGVKDGKVVKFRRTELEYELRRFKVDGNILTLIDFDGKSREFDLTRL